MVPEGAEGDKGAFDAPPTDGYSVGATPSVAAEKSMDPTRTANPGEPTFAQRIDALRATKNQHTDIKVRRDGYFDTDDHGYIPWDEPIPFEPVSDRTDGEVYGIGAIGRNFAAGWRRTRLHPPLLVAGGRLDRKGIPGLGGWRPEDRPTHLAPLQAKYNIYNHGIGAANHLGPDMAIGLRLGWGGLLDKIRHYRALNRPAHTDFYDGEEDLVLGVQGWVARHAALAPAWPPRSPTPPSATT